MPPKQTKSKSQITAISSDNRVKEAGSSGSESIEKVAQSQKTVTEKRGRGRLVKGSGGSGSSGKKNNNSNKRLPIQSYSFARFIHRVMKEIHPQLRISKQSMSIINSFVIDIFERLAREASRIHRRSKSKTMSSRDIAFAVRLLIPAELAEHANAEATKAVTKYMKSY